MKIEEINDSKKSKTKTKKMTQEQMDAFAGF